MKLVKEIEPGGKIVSFKPRNRKIFEIVINTKKSIIETDKLIEYLLNKNNLYNFDKEKLKNVFDVFF